MGKGQGQLINLTLVFEIVGCSFGGTSCIDLPTVVHVNVLSPRTTLTTATYLTKAWYSIHPLSTVSQLVLFRVTGSQRGPGQVGSSSQDSLIVTNTHTHWDSHLHFSRGGGIWREPTQTQGTTCKLQHDMIHCICTVLQVLWIAEAHFLNLFLELRSLLFSNQLT